MANQNPDVLDFLFGFEFYNFPSASNSKEEREAMCDFLKCFNTRAPYKELSDDFGLGAMNILSTANSTT